MKKPGCYECVYRRDIPGDCHSLCAHPATGGEGDIFDKVFATFTGEAAAELHVIGNANGIRSGWFMWPANFDPVWLENCDGFTAKETEAGHEL